MAMIHHRKLIDDYGWSKLTPSARVLFLIITAFCNFSGFGKHSWWWLKKYAGIKSNSTFKKARDELLVAGLLKFEKNFQLYEHEGRKLPKAITSYQVTESVIWKNRPIDGGKYTQVDSLHSARNVTTLSGHEEETIQEENREENNKQPSAVNITYKEKTGRGGSPIAISEILRGEFDRLGELLPLSLDNTPKYKWQVHAQRTAEYLNINIKRDREWYGLFKKAYQVGKEGLLDKATTFCFDYEGAKDKKKLFFWEFHRLLKGE
ncbi:hypothetical protein A3F62_02165 [Candidatus Woesebacteria bacterium RIFCSPHIGHO2_12_FULL_44_11]|uniref:Uncharacterized protein n=1 Tax=Candidatus Woesebacteria bacterium RIFCSPLOWO2_01_FULL_44_14 TaxID=1802525 RepID=A0A1F8C3J4_9BACT|nr:MAG: hypothetical protein A3F62_02165 [Candidatus Woesebacteria bacterium RIFCSPHIGHO2_12_FULL_44_11]OGM70866.1 MAG: hypothetical protein A2975_01155 [Candidatus Woesebacteria bacterium RIFCSPLOWO2_01_FULL_44_14]